MMPYDAYIELIRHLDDLVATFEQHPDKVTREQAGALLTGLDALHREGLQRLVNRVRDAGGAALLDKATDDPVVETLLGLYDLADLNLPEATQPGPGESGSFIPLDGIAVRRSSPDRSSRKLNGNG